MSLHEQSADVQENVSGMLSHLSLDKNNQVEIVQEGILPVLKKVMITHQSNPYMFLI